MIEQIIAQAKDEILDDISKGIVPADIASFEDLHDYVDANMYGIEGRDFDDFDKLIALAETYQPILDQWIKTDLKRKKD